MAIPFCPLCASDENTSVQSADDGREFAVCAAADHGDSGYVWESSPPHRSPRRGDGLGAELEIWDKLLESVPDGGPHAYGAVEDSFIARYPRDAELLQERYGHRWREGRRSASPFSMSSYLAARLSELADERLLVKTFGPAEGPWSYNSVISYWVRA
jgi:hypothetical protein